MGEWLHRLCPGQSSRLTSGQYRLHDLRRQQRHPQQAAACDREQRMSAGRRPTLLVYRVICSDEDAMHWREEDIGNLRVALNALVKLFRL